MNVGYRVNKLMGNGTGPGPEVINAKVPSGSAYKRSKTTDPTTHNGDSANPTYI